MDELLREVGVRAPFVVLGAMAATVIWGRRRGVAGPDVPHRSWFRGLGSVSGQGAGAPALPPDPLRPFEHDRSG